MTIRILFFLFLSNLSTAQISLNVDLFGQFHRGDERYSGCWAYTDSLGNEYALLGAKTGTAAYSIDSPIISELGFVSGPVSNWREITVMGDYAYVTTEGFTDSTGLQIIDLGFLPDSLHLVTTYDSTFTRGHILQRDMYSDSAYIYVNGTPETDGTHILDVSDPENPVEVGVYNPGYYIHDCFVKGDLLFACAFYESRVDIVDISDKTNPFLITQIEHFDGNTHSAWMTEDDRFLMVTAELDGTPSRIYNIEDLNNISEVASYTANFESLVHNPYIRGGYSFISHNTEGLRVLDIHDPELPVEVGYYDTWADTSGGFHGLWSACPFYPSGKIIGGNREDGLYVWEFNNTKAGRIYFQVRGDLSIEPVPNALVIIEETGDSLYTDFNGQVSWGGLPGSYTFYFSADLNLNDTLTVELAACDSLNIEFILTPVGDGVNDIYKNLPKLSIAPNPSNGVINIDFEKWESSSSLLIYNALGQEVYSRKLNGELLLSLDLTAFKSGTYQVLLVDKIGYPIARNSLIIVP